MLDLDQLLLDRIHVGICVVDFSLSTVCSLFVPQHLVDLHPVFLFFLEQPQVCVHLPHVVHCREDLFLASSCLLFEVSEHESLGLQADAAVVDAEFEFVVLSQVLDLLVLLIEQLV